MRLTVTLALILTLLLGYLQQRLWLGIGSVSAVAALQAEVMAQSWQNAELNQRNAALAAEVADLKTGDVAIEERARNELGMIKPGEVFYRVVDRDGVLEPSQDPP